MPSTPRRATAWAWGFPSAALSSTGMEADSGPSPTTVRAPRSRSPFPRALGRARRPRRNAAKAHQQTSVRLDRGLADVELSANLLQQAGDDLRHDLPPPRTCGTRSGAKQCASPLVAERRAAALEGLRASRLHAHG